MATTTANPLPTTNGIKNNDDTSSTMDTTSSTTSNSILSPSNFPQTLTNNSTIHIELTYDSLDPTTYLRFTRSPTSGANVLFLGTTRNNFDNRPVTRLSYSAYPKLALKSLYAIAEEVLAKYQGLEKLCVVHRLGEVGIGEESIAVCVSAAHRLDAWKGAEEVLERVKERAEIWKREWFGDGGGGIGTRGSEAGEDVAARNVGEENEEVGVWRANKDRDASGRLKDDSTRFS